MNKLTRDGIAKTVDCTPALNTNAIKDGIINFKPYQLAHIDRFTSLKSKQRESRHGLKVN